MVTENKRKKILEGKSHEKIEALEAKESRKKAEQVWNEKYKKASPTERKIMDINLSIDSKESEIEKLEQKKSNAEKLHFYDEVDEYKAKIRTAKNTLKGLKAKRSKLEQQRAEEKLNRQVSKDSIQSNTSKQSQKSNASKQATKNNTEKEPPKRQVSKDSIQSNTSKQSQKSNVSKQATNINAEKEPPNRQASKSSIQSNTSKQSQKSNASKQATNIHTEKEPPNRQRSVTSLVNEAQQNPQTQNRPKETRKELYREMSNLRIAEGEELKKLTEISEKISKVESLETVIATNHEKLEQLSEKIKATSKWSGLRNLWRIIRGKESRSDKIHNYKEEVKELTEITKSKESELEKMSPKLKELKAEQSQVSTSLMKIRIEVAVNEAKQSKDSNKQQKRTSQQSLNIV